MIDVSCICPTYGRPHLLEESIESFLRQDFGGKAEMIILNDDPKQELRLADPRVRVVNLDTKFPTLGEKYNYGFHMARGKYLCAWEDDDIFLPHRLSLSVERIEAPSLEYWKQPYALLSQYGQIETVTSNVFWCAGIWTRDLVMRVKGCERVNSPADVSIEEKMHREANGLEITAPRRLEDIFYVYRWGGVGVHLSGFGGDDTESLAKAQAMLDEHRDREGRIDLEPRWDSDYTADAMSFLQQQGAKYADICSNSE